MKLFIYIILIFFSIQQLSAETISHDRAEALLIKTLSENSKTAKFREKYADFEKSLYDHVGDSKTAKFIDSYKKVELGIVIEHVKGVNLDACSLESKQTILVCDNRKYQLK